MKKIALLAAAVLVSSLSFAQPGPAHHGNGPHMKRAPSHQVHRPHAKKKVWVKAHREHGRVVKGHYVWR